MGEIQHIISAAPFTPVNMEPIFVRAQELREQDRNPTARRLNASKFIGRRAINLFYGESTRTRTSFEMAEVAWGMGYSSTENARQFSSAAKGETLEHTIEVAASYNPDFIVLRHDKAGGADRAAAVSEVPIINAADGRGEHPTQAYLDAYTIWEKTGRLDNLRVTFMGDLMFGRTIRSLLLVLAKEPTNQFDFVSDPALSLAPDIKEMLDEQSVTYREHTSASALKQVLPETDIWYVTRTQKNLGAPATASDEFRVTTELADQLPDSSIIMHPMPIDRSEESGSEIASEVDIHPRAGYIRQAGNGFYVRMALLEAINEGRSITGDKI